MSSGKRSDFISGRRYNSVLNSIYPLYRPGAVCTGLLVVDPVETCSLLYEGWEVSLD